MNFPWTFWFTNSDGDSVMLSTQRGVAAKAKALYNSKLFVQHCLNYRIVLACKAGQRHIPKDVEDTICDVLNIFKYSAVYTSRLEEILELNGEKYTKSSSLPQSQVAVIASMHG